MRGYMFRNRWFALLFVALVLAGVTKFVGTGKNDGAIDVARSQLTEQREIAEQFTTQTQPETVSGDDVTIEFSSDEELIDPATGEDPTPTDDFVSPDGPEEIPADEVVIVSQEAPPPAAPVQ